MPTRWASGLWFAVMGQTVRQHGVAAELSEPARLRKTDIHLLLWPAVWAPQHWLPFVSSSPSHASFFSVSSPLLEPASLGLSSKNPSEITLCSVMIALQPRRLKSAMYGLFIGDEALRHQSCRQIEYQGNFRFLISRSVSGLRVGLSHDWQQN